MNKATRANAQIGTIVLAIVLAGMPAAQAESLASRAFADLSTLVGEWEGSYANGRSHQVSFELTANGSALLETWTMSPTRQSLTVYALDGERLISTHYCPQGNQPRLVLRERDDSGRYQFEFLDGTNLHDPAGSHQHALSIQVDSAQNFSRSEVYLSNAASQLAADAHGEIVSYRRTAP